MNTFHILEGIVDAAGDMIDDRRAVEAALSVESVQAYAESALDTPLSTADAEKIRAAGLEWVRSVNEGAGEWSRYRHEAQAALD